MAYGIAALVETSLQLSVEVLVFREVASHLTCLEKTATVREMRCDFMHADSWCSAPDSNIRQDLPKLHLQGYGHASLQQSVPGSSGLLQVSDLPLLVYSKLLRRRAFLSPGKQNTVRVRPRHVLHCASRLTICSWPEACQQPRELCLHSISQYRWTSCALSGYT